MKLPYLLIFSVVLLACNKPQPETQTAEAPADSVEAPSDVLQLTADQVRMADLQTGRVEYRNLSQTLTLNGRVVAGAQNRATVSALQGGFIRQIALLPGQAVRKGQVLARVENPDLIQVQQDYAENRARLTYLESEYARQQELSRENVGALKVFQQTSADLNATRARLSALAQRIQRVGLSPEAAVKGQFNSTYAVTSPINGIISDVPANLGQYVQPSDVIAQLIGTEGLYAELTVFEKDLGRVREGQLLRVQMANEGGRERMARIYLLNRTIDNDRSVRVLARFEPGTGNRPLIPNAFLKATLELGNVQTPALPEGAIVTAEGKDYIFVQQAPEKAGTPFRAILVRRGVTQNGYSAVVLPEGFSMNGSAVVVRGAYSLLSQWLGAGAEEE
jgi:membrane fusion protein, heavy metal efflux system